MCSYPHLQSKPIEWNGPPAAPSQVNAAPAQAMPPI